MTEYYQFVTDELISKLNQVKSFITKHNTTIGILTEEILRDFLGKYLSKGVSVEQGFIMNQDGKMSKQCDIIIYDSQLFAPFYRINDIVVVPSESVISIIEVKTTVAKTIFHETITYFKSFKTILEADTNKHLFIYNAPSISNLQSYFLNYKHPTEYQLFDHDTFQDLPTTITGINKSYHLKQDYVIFESDMKGYLSYHFQKLDLEISSLQLFFSTIQSEVANYQTKKVYLNFEKPSRRNFESGLTLSKISAIKLFEI